MEKTGHLFQHPEAAFTLIELIVVVAIIGLLAAMVLPVVGAVNARKQISLAQTQLKGVEFAIDGYKTKLGFYPPDNTNNPAMNPLYFELLGTTNMGIPGTVYGTLDGSATITSIPDAPYNIPSVFSRAGFANTSTHAHSDDQGATCTSFLNNLSASQIGLAYSNVIPVKILLCSVPWPSDKQPSPIPGLPNENPWNYVSTYPTNNPSSYDLWVDIVIKGRTNRVCNWSTQPIRL